MIPTKRVLVLSLFTGFLTACATTESNYGVSESYYATSYQPVESKVLSYEYSDNDDDYRQSTATVPDSYYTGSARAPTSHKDMDRNWVSSQNAKAYTIQIGESENASQVASRLYKAPKNDRSAQLKYNREGQSYYKGVYGTFNNYEEAQKALNELSPEIKQGAEIKSWSAVQEGIL
ncbi:MAG: SPOR domain-containing protein [Tatlockia sp.]|nr:SPOR domain-containing protein [Tatlockia sp.]